MKQTGYLAGIILLLALGFFFGREFLQFQAIERAKIEARDYYHAGVVQKIEDKQAHGFWSKDYKLPAGFSYPDGFVNDTDVRLTEYSSAVLFYAKPIYSLPKWVVVDRNGVVSVHYGDISELLQM